MKYQEIIQAKDKLDELIKDREKHLVELKYNSECIKQTIAFLRQSEIIPHEAGRGNDNGERRKQARGLSSEILEIINIDSKPVSAKDILECLSQDFEDCTINSVTGLLCLMTQDGRVGRIKQNKRFHYFINSGGAN